SSRRVDRLVCVALLTPRLPPGPALFPYTTLFRSGGVAERADGDVDPAAGAGEGRQRRGDEHGGDVLRTRLGALRRDAEVLQHGRSEEHTSELQSRENLVCRLLLERKNMTALLAWT